MKLNRQQKMLIVLGVALAAAWQLGWLNLGSQQVFMVWPSCAITGNSVVCSGNYPRVTGQDWGIQADPSCKIGDRRNGDQYDFSYFECQSGARKDLWPVGWPAQYRTCSIDYTIVYRDRGGCGYTGQSDARINQPGTIKLFTYAPYINSVGCNIDSIPVPDVLCTPEITVQKVVIPLGPTAVTTTTTPGTTTTIPQPGPIEGLANMLNQLFDGIFNVIRQLLGWMRIV